MKLFYTESPVSSRRFTEQILRDYYGEHSEIAVGEHGKPYLVSSSLHFNLSHSGKITALAVSEREIGLDIQIRERREIPALLRRLTEAERREDFFRLWTAKEAYVKYRGGALANMLPALEYRDNSLFEKGAPVNAALQFFELADCAVCVCTEFPEPAETVLITL